MKAVIPEIYVRDCKTALHTYQELFGGEIKNLQMSDNLDMFHNLKNKVVHSELHVSSRCILYFVDVLEKRRGAPGNVTVMLHMHTKQELERIYSGLALGGQVGMELQKNRFGEHHAIVTDRFGAPWALHFTPRQGG